MKNAFIVTSCIKPLSSSISYEDRYKQTIETFLSVKNKDPDSVLIFADASYVDVFIDYSQDENMKRFNQSLLKSHGECYMLLKTISWLKDTGIELDRIFKLGGRCKLTDSFNISDYENTKGKYVFKKKINSWMEKTIQDSYGSPFILETRLYSFCYSLIDDYIQVLIENFELFNKGLDTEHSHFINIKKDKLIEFDYVNCECVVAGIQNSIMVD